jgi:hypothetical protein
MWFGGWIVAMTGWVRQRLVAALFRAWLRYWLYSNSHILFRHLWDAGYPGKNGPDLYVPLSQPHARERFLNALVYAMERTIKDATERR